jgi:hypothetical protein
VTVLRINAVYENRDYCEERSKSDVSPEVSHSILVFRRCSLPRLIPRGLRCPEPPVRAMWR